MAKMEDKKARFIYNTIKFGAECSPALLSNTPDSSIKLINDNIFKYITNKRHDYELREIPDDAVLDLMMFIATNARESKDQTKYVSFMDIIESYIHYLKYSSTLEFEDNNYMKNIITENIVNDIINQFCFSNKILKGYEFTYSTYMSNYISEDKIDSIREFMLDLFVQNGSFKMPVNTIFYAYCLYSDDSNITVKEFIDVLERINIDIDQDDEKLPAYIKNIGLSHKGHIFFDFVYPASKKVRDYE